MLSMNMTWPIRTYLGRTKYTPIETTSTKNDTGINVILL